jgi:uncharacterized membrane protein YtjA (UPF0391 family)
VVCSQHNLYASRRQTPFSGTSQPIVEISQLAANQSRSWFACHRNQFRCSKLDQAISRRAADPAVEVLRSGPMTILKWALIFFLVSIVAGILGFTDISATSADVARFLFYVFVVIFLVLLILGLTIFRV